MSYDAAPHYLEFSLKAKVVGSILDTLIVQEIWLALRVICREAKSARSDSLERLLGIMRNLVIGVLVHS